MEILLYSPAGQLSPHPKVKGVPLPESARLHPICPLVFARLAFLRLEKEDEFNENFVDEIGRFVWPALWNVFSFYWNLFCEDLIPDFPSRSSQIGPFSHHAFVGDYSEGVVIYGHTMILPAHHFWSYKYNQKSHQILTHIAWCSTCILCIVLS